MPKERTSPFPNVVVEKVYDLVGTETQQTSRIAHAPSREPIAISLARARMIMPIVLSVEVCGEDRRGDYTET